MKEVIMKVPSFSADYPKAPIYVAELVRCGECIYWKNSLCQAWHRVIPKDGYCSIGERDGSTQTETQNSNLTFKTLEYCDICDHKGCEECISNALDEHCIPSQFKKQIEDECAKEYEELGLKELKELIEADRKTENSLEKPNNSTNADQHVQHVESVEPTWTREEHEAFYAFLWNVINPNEMQDYIGMFETKDEPQTDPLPKAINGVNISDAVAWADKWLEDNPVSEMWDMIRTLRDATEWQDEPQTERSE